MLCFVLCVLCFVLCFVQRKFSSKTSELQTNVQGQCCHHVHVSYSHHGNHIITSTIHPQVVGKRNSSEACEFTGENTLSRARNPVFCRVKWLPWSPKYGRFFRGCGPLNAM